MLLRINDAQDHRKCQAESTCYDGGEFRIGDWENHTDICRNHLKEKHPELLAELVFELIDAMRNHRLL